MAKSSNNVIAKIKNVKDVIGAREKNDKKLSKTLNKIINELQPLLTDSYNILHGYWKEFHALAWEFKTISANDFLEIIYECKSPEELEYYLVPWFKKVVLVRELIRTFNHGVFLLPDWQNIIERDYLQENVDQCSSKRCISYCSSLATTIKEKIEKIQGDMKGDKAILLTKSLMLESSTLCDQCEETLEQYTIGIEKKLSEVKYFIKEFEDTILEIVKIVKLKDIKYKNIETNAENIVNYCCLKNFKFNNNCFKKITDSDYYLFMEYNSIDEDEKAFAIKWLVEPPVNDQDLSTMTLPLKQLLAYKIEDNIELGYVLLQEVSKLAGEYESKPKPVEYELRDYSGNLLMNTDDNDEDVITTPVVKGSKKKNNSLLLSVNSKISNSSNTEKRKLDKSNIQVKDVSSSKRRKLSKANGKKVSTEDSITESVTDLFTVEDDASKEPLTDNSDDISTISDDHGLFDDTAFKYLNPLESYKNNQLTFRIEVGKIIAEQLDRDSNIAQLAKEYVQVLKVSSKSKGNKSIIALLFEIYTNICKKLVDKISSTKTVGHENKNDTSETYRDIKKETKAIRTKVARAILPVATNIFFYFHKSIDKDNRWLQNDANISKDEILEIFTDKKFKTYSKMDMIQLADCLTKSGDKAGAHLVFNMTKKTNSNDKMLSLENYIKRLVIYADNYKKFNGNYLKIVREVKIDTPDKIIPKTKVAVSKSKDKLNTNLPTSSDPPQASSAPTTTTTTTSLSAETTSPSAETTSPSAETTSPSAESSNKNNSKYEVTTNSMEPKVLWEPPLNASEYVSSFLTLSPSISSSDIVPPPNVAQLVKKIEYKWNQYVTKHNYAGDDCFFDPYFEGDGFAPFLMSYYENYIHFMQKDLSFKDEEMMKLVEPLLIQRFVMFKLYYIGLKLKSLPTDLILLHEVDFNNEDTLRLTTNLDGFGVYRCKMQLIKIFENEDNEAISDKLLMEYGRGITYLDLKKAITEDLLHNKGMETDVFRDELIKLEEAAIEILNRPGPYYFLPLELQPRPECFNAVFEWKFIEDFGPEYVILVFDSFYPQHKNENFLRMNHIHTENGTGNCACWNNDLIDHLNTFNHIGAILFDEHGVTVLGLSRKQIEIDALEKAIKIAYSTFANFISNLFSNTDFLKDFKTTFKVDRALPINQQIVLKNKNRELDTFGDETQMPFNDNNSSNSVSETVMTPKSYSHEELHKISKLFELIKLGNMADVLDYTEKECAEISAGIIAQVK